MHSAVLEAGADLHVVLPALVKEHRHIVLPEEVGRVLQAAADVRADGHSREHLRDAGAGHLAEQPLGLQCREEGHVDPLVVEHGVERRVVLVDFPVVVDRVGGDRVAAHTAVRLQAGVVIEAARQPVVRRHLVLELRE